MTTTDAPATDVTATGDASARQRPSLRAAASAATARLGWSEGDAWTVGIGLSLALVLAVSTIPPVLDARGSAQRTAAPTAPAAVPPAPPVVAELPPPVVAPVPAEQPPLPPLSLPPPAPLPPTDPTQEGPVAGPPATRAPAPGEVRRFADVPGGATPGAVAVAADGRVWAGTDEPVQAGEAARLLAWDAAGALRATVAVPGQPADRTRGLTAATTLPDGTLAAVDAATSRLVRYDGRSWSTLTTVPDVPACLGVRPAPCQPGVLDTAPLLRGAALGTDGEVFLADAGQGAVWRLPRGGALELWYASSDLAGPDGVAGLATGSDGHLRAVVTRVADVQGTGAGALLRIERTADGGAGSPSVVTGFRPGEDPVDVVLGTSGHAYVALRGADAVVTLDPAGVEQLRVVDDGLQGPTSLDLAAGRLLVAVTGPRPAVVAVGVRDAPVVPRPPRTAGGPRR